MGKIDDYKSRLGYGVRTNLFRIELTFPSVILEAAPIKKLRETKGGTGGNKFDNVFDLMAHSITFPGARPAQPIPIAVLGEYFKVAGERGEYADLTVSWREPQDFAMRNAVEYWLDYIQNYNFGSFSGVRHEPKDYKGSMKIYSLDRTLSDNRVALVQGVFPTNMDGFEMSADATDLVMGTTVFAVDNYTLVGR